jgi:hypothetical protein
MTLLASLLPLMLIVPTSVGTTRPSLRLTASPAHVTLNGSARTAVRVSNSGSSTVLVDVRRAGFALDLRGRPRIVASATIRRESSWLTVRPHSFTLRPGGSTSLTVAARVPTRAEPGDHTALVLVTARPRPRAGLIVRMRLGVVVDIRAPGRIVHRLVPLRLRLGKPDRRSRTFDLLVANRGNVTEELGSRRATLTLTRDGKTIAKVRGEPRRMLPRARGVIVFRYRGRARGTMSAVVVLTPNDGDKASRRTYRLRL